MNNKRLEMKNEKWRTKNEKKIKEKKNEKKIGNKWKIKTEN